MICNPLEWCTVAIILFSPIKTESARLEVSLSSLNRHHEQSSLSRVKKIYGQEVSLEIKRCQTCPGNTAETRSVYESGGGSMCGDGN